MRKHTTDAKVIPGEEVALQCQLLVCDTRFDVPPKHKYTPCLKVLRLKDPQRRNHSQGIFNLHVSGSTDVADGYTLWVYGTSRQAFSRQLRRCVAQLGPTVGGMKPAGGMSM